MLSVLALGALALPAAGDNWVVLAAGSNGYWNYRHQADLCHAYKIVSSRGIPDEHIITLFYDDVAADEHNPYPNQLFNHPDGEDVYAGCKKDYTGKMVTPQNFISVLTGDADAVPAGLPVLNSTAADRVFVYFVDHGGVDLIGFPESTLHSAKLNSALALAHRKGLFKELVFYLETCESGSIFEDRLPAHLPVYAVTAANAHESSWGTFCPPHDEVRGTALGTCLGDLFSVSWMDDSERALAMRETLHAQFEAVRALTDKSHVQQYGDVTLSFKETVGDFEAEAAALATIPARPDGSPPLDRVLSASSAVTSRNATIHSLWVGLQRAPSARGARLLEQAQGRRAAEGARWNRILAAAVSDPLRAREILALADVSGDGRRGARAGGLDRSFAACHEKAAEAFQEQCGGWSEEALPYSACLHGACALLAGDGTGRIVGAIREVCTSGGHAREATRGKAWREGSVESVYSATV